MKISAGKVIIIMSVIILILILYIIFHTHPSPPDLLTPRIKRMKDSMSILESKAKAEETRASNLEKQLDYINSLPPQIKYVYLKQKQQIVGDDSRQLDSVIRTIAGLPKRY